MARCTMAETVHTVAEGVAKVIVVCVKAAVLNFFIAFVLRRHRDNVNDN